MKIKLSRSRLGGTLLVTLLTASVIGTLLVAYLGVINDQYRATVRSEMWNSCIPVLEAGVEVALEHINTFPSNLNNTPFFGPYGPGNNEFYSYHPFDNSRQWAITIISNTNPHVIYSYGYVQMPATYQWIWRLVRVNTTNTPLFAKAMVARGQINLNGFNIGSDSFDPTDPNFSTGGQYDPAKRKDNGDVATTSGLVNSLNVGNAKIRGRISTGPGGSVAIGANGSVGDNAWVGSNQTGIKAGYFSDDMNVQFPDVRPPFSGGAPPPGSGNVGGTNYSFVLTGGNYQMSALSMSGSQEMIVTGNATLYVTGNVSITGNGKIIIAPGGSLKIYVAGSSAQIGGNGVANESGNANKFAYYGLPTNTSISFAGNAGFTGTVYAPQAALSLGGGGSDTYDFVGSTITNTVQMNGHFRFHYDESLGKFGPVRAYVVTAWNEL